MKRLLVLLSVPFLFLIAFAVPAQAASPHFVSASAKISGTNLVVSFKEAGLGNNQLITYTASASATATYVCVNNGGKHPSAQNKETVSGPVTATSPPISSGKNGTISSSLTLSPPSSGSFSCPSGQSPPELAQVSYTDVTVSDDTTPVSQSISGTFSTGCLLPNVKGAC